MNKKDNPQSTKWCKKTAMKKIAPKRQGKDINLLTSVHVTAAGLHKAGLLDKATMREIGAMCSNKANPMLPR